MLFVPFHDWITDKNAYKSLETCDELFRNYLINNQIALEFFWCLIDQEMDQKWKNIKL